MINKLSPTPIQRRPAIIPTAGTDITQPDAEFTRILDNICEAFFSTDAATHSYVFISPACERIYGYLPSDFMADFSLWQRVIHPDDAEAAAPDKVRLYLGERMAYQYRIIHKDGDIRWVDVKVIPTLVNGTLHRVDAVVLDITAQKEARIQLEAANTELTALFNNIDDVMYSADMATRRITQMSPSCEVLYGYTPEEFYSDRTLWKSLLHPEDKHLFEEHMSRIRIGSKVRGDYRIIRRDGATRWIENTVIPSVNVTGDVIRLDGISRDITDRVLAEQALVRANLELNTLFNTIDEVIYSVDVTGAAMNTMSPGCEKVYGYKPQEFCDDVSLWYRVTHPDDMLRVSGHYTAMNRGEHIIDRCRIIHKSGAIRWVEYNMVPTLNEHGVLMRIDGVTRDITDRKLVEDQLDKAHQELGHLFNSISEVLYSLDMVGNKFLQMSPACERIFGYGPDAFMNDVTLWRSLIHSEDVAFIYDNKPLLEAGKVLSSQYRIRHRDGNWRWIESTVSPTLDEQGTLIRLDGVATDITQRKLAEEALMKSEANLRAVFENTDTGYLLIDSSLHIISFNQQIQRFARLHGDKIFEEGASVLRYFEQSRMSMLQEMMLKALAGESVQYEISFEQPGALPVWYFIRMLAVGDGEEGLIGLTLSFTDISERKNNEEHIKALNGSLEAKVKQRTAELEVSNNELEAFGYSISHDLRAPLRIIHGYGHMLMAETSDRLSTDEKDSMQVILDTAGQMGRLIDDLLNFSRMGRAAFDKRPASMTDMVRAVITELNTHKDHPAAITLDALPAAYCDPALTRQVWVNLISNAIKYSAKCEDPQISIGVMDIDGAAAYYVRDNGAGFDMKYADKLFGVFQRLHTVTDYEGTGVGLALARRIVTRQGGRIWAEAAVGLGATFYFTLPEVAPVKKAA